MLRAAPGGAWRRCRRRRRGAASLATAATASVSRGLAAPLTRGPKRGACPLPLRAPPGGAPASRHPGTDNVQPTSAERRARGPACQRSPLVATTVRGGRSGLGGTTAARCLAQPHRGRPAQLSQPMPPLRSEFGMTAPRPGRDPIQLAGGVQTKARTATTAVRLPGGEGATEKEPPGRAPRRAHPAARPRIRQGSG